MGARTVYLSVCLLLALSASVGTYPVGNKRCGACWAGWTAFECRCFKFFNNPQTWIEAEKSCLGFEGNLASVHSHEEYMFLQNLIRYETQATTRTWIGGHDAVSEGVWLWSDGTKMDFQIWSPGNPDNYEGYEHCLEMNHSDGNWNDLPCSDVHKLPFVCAN